MSAVAFEFDLWFIVDYQVVLMYDVILDRIMNCIGQVIVWTL